MRLMLVEQDENEWVFPKYNTDQVDIDLVQALDLLESGETNKLSGARLILENIVEDNLNNIDALHHLAMTYELLGLEKKAFHYWKDAVRAGKTYFPKKFILGKSLLNYYELKNRSFLRSYHALGLSYWKLGMTDKAINIFNNLLGSCPSDNLGCRLVLPLFYFINKDYASVISITEKYIENDSDSMVYNYALAHLLNGQNNEGLMALKKAVNMNTFFLDRLLDRDSETQEKVFTGDLTESEDYYDTYGCYWNSSSDAMLALRSVDPKSN